MRRVNDTAQQQDDDMEEASSVSSDAERQSNDGRHGDAVAEEESYPFVPHYRLLRMPIRAFRILSNY